MIDLAKLPVYAEQRDERHPLILAGGHAAFNPEPMSPFIDAFVIGEGEEIFPKIIDCYRSWKNSGKSRNDLLEELIKFDGVYVPRFYDVAYHADGTVNQIQPISDRYERNPKDHRPDITLTAGNQHVPTIDVIKPGAIKSCAAARGMPLCQAGYVTRPVL